MPSPRDLIHLRAAGVSAVVDLGDGPPAVRYWGADIGEAADLDGFRSVLDPAAPRASLDVVAPTSLVPEHGSGFGGHPGLSGRRADGSAWAPRFSSLVRVASSASSVAVEVDDPVASLRLTAVIALDDSTGVLSAETSVTNIGSTVYWLDDLGVTVPLPGQATELLTFDGRWCRELAPRRVPFELGSYLAENRRGRTSHDHLPMLWAGTPGFGEWHGEVWGLHLAWSGNHRVRVERMIDGRGYVQLGELLHPGEIELAAGETYNSPKVWGTYAADGLTAATQAWHRRLRARPTHPVRPRPILVNTWEAVYFNHDLDTLKELATAAADVGAERFVLDDGWFGGRRNDTSSLGDWWVSPDAHPEGLEPLISHVTGLGLEFGIWVEPEMVNPDSDLYRAHPEWALTTDGYEPVTGRNQLVLNLADPDAYAHIFRALDALVADHDVAYVKWDMNRDHTQGSGVDGRAGTHAQTLAVYRMLDELRTRHPGVEIESCSSGGARIDYEILERTDRVWTSDCNDALERQVIQRGASMLIPPELMGAHIGPPTSHTTGRTHPLPFRAATALFGHFGIEWNLLGLTTDERSAVAEVVAMHKRFRPLLHGGDVVRFDHPGSAAVAHGVYAPDRSEALVSFALVESAQSLHPAPLRLPGLNPDARYTVTHVALPGQTFGPTDRFPAWMDGGTTVTGRQLATHGIQLPSLHPETALLLHVSSSPARR